MLDRTKLLQLTGMDSEPALTITMPTYRVMPEAEQNAIRFRNLLNRARRELSEHRVDSRTASRLLEEPEKLLDRYQYWQHQEDGLAVFSDGSLFEVEKTAVSLPECVRIGRGFAVKPFLRLLEPAPSFLVLAAAWEDVRLFRNDGDRLRPVTDEDLPGTIERLAGITEIEDNVHHHPTGPKATTGGEAWGKFHALGTAAPEERAKMRGEFAAALAREIDHLLRREPELQLVLVADERMSGMLAGRLKHEAVRAPQSQVSPAALAPEALRDIALGALAEAEGGKQHNRLEQLHAHLGDHNSDRASLDVSEIATAAVMGRVAHLYVDPSRELRGRLDEATGEIGSGDGEDLLDAVARLTLRQNGEVHGVDAAALPGDAAVAAVYRY